MEADEDEYDTEALCFFLSFFFHPCPSCHWKCFCWHLFTILLTFIHHITIHHSSLTAGLHRSYKSAVFTKFAPSLFIWMELLVVVSPLCGGWGSIIHLPIHWPTTLTTHTSQNKYAYRLPWREADGTLSKDHTHTEFQMVHWPLHSFPPHFHQLQFMCAALKASLWVIWNSDGRSQIIWSPPSLRVCTTKHNLVYDNTVPFFLTSSRFTSRSSVCPTLPQRCCSLCGCLLTEYAHLIVELSASLETLYNTRELSEILHT